MSPLESIVLGAVQGITEFLPISSSAHLIILPWFLKINEGNVNQLTFDVMLHFGTLIAILTLYGKRFVTIVVEGLYNLKERKIGDSLLCKIVVATLPAVVLGVLCKGLIEEYLRTPYTTVFGLMGVSILMIVCERIYYTREKGISYAVAIAIGVAQALALVPGVSRSGITIAVGILLGLKRAQAVEFSFLLSIPIILGVSLYESKHLNFQGIGVMEIYALGVASSFLFGFISLKFLIRFLKKHSLDVFAAYRIGLALLILFLSF